MQWAVIMAGGSGTRFWPLSSDTHPKQFLRLIGDKTPAQACLDRLKKVIPTERIMIVASASHRKSLADALPDFPVSQILWEPVGRNTAPCIAWAAETIRSKDPDAVIGVFPSDHDIDDPQAFADSLRRAYDAADGKIVLFGIEPSRPETGYGYIEEGESIGADIYRVASFREKPDRETASKYIEAGRFLWNSGMFIFDAEVMHGELSRLVPQIVEGVEKIVNHPESLEDEFPKLLSISIDYAVMEHTDRAAVMRAAYPWDDLGTWDSIARYYPADAEGNAVRGDVTAIDCRHTFVYAGDSRPVAILGLQNVIVVSTPEAVLVMDENRAQDVRKITAARKK